jgi:predicted ATPase
MIKKLKVQNYKSLKNVELELDKFNVLIGPNASGKSNLLDCLVFLSEIAQKGIDESLKGRGGYEHVLFYGEKGNIELSIDFISGTKRSNYFISISDEEVVEEGLSINGKKIIERHLRQAKILVSPDTEEYSSHGLLPWSSAISTAITFSEIKARDEYKKAVEFLPNWRSYNFITSEMRRTYSAKRNLILDRNGGNLAQVLLSLHNERPKTFDKIENMLKEAIPQVDELLTPLTEGGETYVAMREKGFDSPFDYFQVSDGTLKLLAYITAIATEEPGLISFEEPENFIHPRLFELLSEVLKKSDKQIILSTHSPYLVDWVEPEDVIIVEKKDQETVASRIKDRDKLKKRLEEIGLSLGEYWYGGGLGGNPC